MLFFNRLWAPSWRAGSYILFANSELRSEKNIQWQKWERLLSLCYTSLSALLLGVFSFAWGDWGVKIAKDLLHVAELGFDSMSVWRQTGNLSLPTASCSLCFLMFWSLSGYPENWCQACICQPCCAWLEIVGSDWSQIFLDPDLMIALLFNIWVFFHL